MRRFTSYGPVDCQEHFCVRRKELVRNCAGRIVGNPEKGGHYFTIWAPRQTGKTWIMRQVKKKIEAVYGDRFIIGCMSMQGVILDDAAPGDELLAWMPRLFRDAFGKKPPVPENWGQWSD